MFGDARIKLLRDCVITSAEALSRLIYNCQTRAGLTARWALGMKGTWWSKDEQAPIRKSREGRVASPLWLKILPVKLVAHPVKNS